MPRLIFPVLPDGLLVDVVIGLRGTITATLLASGQPITRPIRARGVIDTGTDRTVVSAAILHRLEVTPSHQASTQTVSGSLSVQLFTVSVGVTDFGDPAAPELVEPDLLVMELGTALPKKIEVLIGLDFLLGCKFLLDGPARKFALEW
jgi:Aspartyl protease